MCLAQVLTKAILFFVTLSLTSISAVGMGLMVGAACSTDDAVGIAAPLLMFPVFSESSNKIA